MVNFGVEEEFMFLDPTTLAPVALGLSALDALRRPTSFRLPNSPDGGRVSLEFLDCQVEFSTSPSATLSDAGTELSTFRQRLGELAAQQNVVVGSVGTPYGSAREASVTPNNRYRTIAHLMGSLTPEHFVNGLHVHTEVRDLEDRVRALNAVRPWLPVLLALTTNSPFWRGEHSGFASWRSIHLRRLATMWCPPAFHDFDDYQRRIDRLVHMNATIDRGSIAWAVRVSDNYDTVEVRLFDAQLSVSDTLFAAALTRSLVTDAPATVALRADEIDASLWMAAKLGMRAQLADPRTGEIAPAWTIAAGLLDELADCLAAHDDDEFVAEQIALLRERGTGADRQTCAMSQLGHKGLRALLAESL